MSTGQPMREVYKSCNTMHVNDLGVTQGHNFDKLKYNHVPGFLLLLIDCNAFLSKCTKILERKKYQNSASDLFSIGLG